MHNFITSMILFVFYLTLTYFTLEWTLIEYFQLNCGKFSAGYSMASSTAHPFTVNLIFWMVQNQNHGQIIYFDSIWKNWKLFGKRLEFFLHKCLKMTLKLVRVTHKFHWRGMYISVVPKNGESFTSHIFHMGVSCIWYKLIEWFFF